MERRLALPSLPLCVLVQARLRPVRVEDVVVRRRLDRLRVRRRRLEELAPTEERVALLLVTLGGGRHRCAPGRWAASPLPVSSHPSRTL